MCDEIDARFEISVRHNCHVGNIICTLSVGIAYTYPFTSSYSIYLMYAPAQYVSIYLMLFLKKTRLESIFNKNFNNNIRTMFEAAYRISIFNNFLVF